MIDIISRNTGGIMIKVLVTGKTGFVGKNMLLGLKARYEIIDPSRQDLDLKDGNAVRTFLENNKMDVILHLANPNPVKNTLDSQSTLFQDSLRIFFNFYTNRELFGKMIYLGSGAEFDKSKDIINATEIEFGRSIPQDEYGFAKYIMNELCIKSSNIYNFRIMACFGPYDHESKFITHAINCCLRNKVITIRQDCWFDYMHVQDLTNIICWGIENNLKFNDYNICSGQRIKLSEIAEIVNELMQGKRGIQILTEGFNKEYTANNSRLIEELSGYEFISIREGIERQIAWQRSNKL